MKKTILASLLAAAALAPMASFASDGTINFSGQITDQTCTINGGQPTFTVTLPKVSASTLAAAGSQAGSTRVPLTLTNCTPASGGVRLYFEPGANVDYTTGRLNVAAGGAQKVQIGLFNDAAGTSKVNIGAMTGGQNTAFFPIAADGTANPVYYALYVSQGGATSGATTTSVTYSLEYQ